MNSLNDISLSFTAMFPDSTIVLQMRLKRTKASRVAIFGIDPHFVSVLNHGIRNSGI